MLPRPEGKREAKLLQCSVFLDPIRKHLVSPAGAGERESKRCRVCTFFPTKGTACNWFRRPRALLAILLNPNHSRFHCSYLVYWLYSLLSAKLRKPSGKVFRSPCYLHETMQVALSARQKEHRTLYKWEHTTREQDITDAENRQALIAEKASWRGDADDLP